MSDNWLKQIPDNIGYYLTGFADGEGSFNISLRNKKDYANNWQTCPCFNVSQKDITILTKFKRYLGCGTIKKRKDGLYMYEVVNYQMLSDRVIPFFRKFSFLSSSKQTNFSIFCQIIEIMNGEHLTVDGFKKVVLLREQLNIGKGRTRKYHIENVYGESSETIR